MGPVFWIGVGVALTILTVALFALIYAKFIYVGYDEERREMEERARLDAAAGADRAR